jgi:zinc and cadmium transporter
VSFAVGALLGAAFLDLLPHVFEASKSPARSAGFILLGILVFFVLEKLMLWRHHHHHDGEETGHPGRGPPRPGALRLDDHHRGRDSTTSPTA